MIFPLTRIFVFAGASALTACTSPAVRLGDPLPAGITPQGGRTLTSQACAFQPNLIPFALATYDRYQRAYQELKDQARGELLTDVGVRESASEVLFIGISYCTSMQARAIKPTAFEPAPGAVVRPALAQNLRSGTQARVVGVVRTRATADGAAVPGVGQHSVVTLKSGVRNTAGAWWYVASPAGSGWVLEGELEPVAP